ncbi:hypothetical protein D3C87_926610 [compost metagenome]
MKALPVSQFVWQIQQQFIRFGWVGALVVVLLGWIIFFEIFFVQPLHSNISALKSEAEILNSQPKVALTQEKILDPAEQLLGFYKFFPKQMDVTDAIAVLYSAAAQNNLNLDQADYHLSQGRDDKLSRYEIALPIKGGYVQVRKFIAQALQQVPNLSLDSISFNRAKIGETLVDAELKFTFYLSAE